MVWVDLLGLGLSYLRNLGWFWLHNHMPTDSPVSTVVSSGATGLDSLPLGDGTEYIDWSGISLGT